GIGYGPYGFGGVLSYQPSATTLMVSASPAASQPARQPVKPVLNLNVAKKGPAAIQQVFGIANLKPGNVGKPVIRTVKLLDRPPVRISNPETRRQAERYIAEGDTLFRAQNFNSASQKYKLAASIAPDLAEAYWRQGHALTAMHQYEPATTAFKRAIA